MADRFSSCVKQARCWNARHKKSLQEEKDTRNCAFENAMLDGQLRMSPGDLSCDHTPYRTNHGIVR